MISTKRMCLIFGWNFVTRYGSYLLILMDSFSACNSQCFHPLFLLSDCFFSQVFFQLLILVLRVSSPYSHCSFSPSLVLVTICSCVFVILLSTQSYARGCYPLVFYFFLSYVLVERSSREILRSNHWIMDYNACRSGERRFDKSIWESQLSLKKWTSDI